MGIIRVTEKRSLRWVIRDSCGVRWQIQFMDKIRLKLDFMGLWPNTQVQGIEL